MNLSFFNGTDITEAVSRPGVADLIQVEQIVSAGRNGTDFKIDRGVLREFSIVEDGIPLGVTDEFVTETRHSFCYGGIELVPKKNQRVVFGLFNPGLGGAEKAVSSTDKMGLPKGS